MTPHDVFHELARQYIQEMEGPPMPEVFIPWMDLPSNHLLQHRFDAALLASGPSGAAMDARLGEFVEAGDVEWDRWCLDHPEPTP